MGGGYLRPSADRYGNFVKAVSHASIASSGASIVADVIRNEVVFHPPAGAGLPVISRYGTWQKPSTDEVKRLFPSDDRAKARRRGSDTA